MWLNGGDKYGCARSEAIFVCIHHNTIRPTLTKDLSPHLEHTAGSIFVSGPADLRFCGGGSLGGGGGSSKSSASGPSFSSFSSFCTYEVHICACGVVGE